jgi:hypothetical protein
MVVMPSQSAQGKTPLYTPSQLREVELLAESPPILLLQQEARKNKIEQITMKRMALFINSKFKGLLPANAFVSFFTQRKGKPHFFKLLITQVVQCKGHKHHFISIL